MLAEQLEQPTKKNQQTHPFSKNTNRPTDLQTKTTKRPNTP